MTQVFGMWFPNRRWGGIFAIGQRGAAFSERVFAAPNQSTTLVPAREERTILLRCDGTSQTGSGHASRSLALAEAFVDWSCRCSFVGHFDAATQDRLAAAGMNWYPLEADSWTEDDASTVTNLVNQLSACGVVVDSYEVNADYVDEVDRGGVPLLLIDDFASLARYDCSAVLNFTSRAVDYYYPKGPHYFLGLRWFLARRTLRRLRVRERHIEPNVRRVLLTSGAHDRYDILLPITESLLSCDRNLSIHVVVGPAYAALPALQHLLESFRGETQIMTRLPDLSGEFSWADVCISGAGLTKYEVAYLGIPSAVLSQNEGQARDTVRFAELGMTVDLGLASAIDRARVDCEVWRLLSDNALRESLSQHALAIFPADPTENLVRALLADVFCN